MSELKRDTLPLKTSNDVVLARQRVRQWAIELKFTLVDQTKLVTAASELARNTLIHGGGGERLHGIAPTAGLRVNMPRHMERVRNVGDQLCVFLAARPRIPGKRRAFESVDDVMVHARMVRRFRQQRAQDRDGLHAGWRHRFLVRLGEPAHDHQGQIELGFHFARMRGQ